MAMDKISGSSLLQQGVLENSRKKEAIDGTTNQDAKTADVAASGVAPASGDTLEISDMAHKLMELRRAVDVGRLSLAAMPDIREDKVAQARERLKSGYYQSAEVRDKVASGIDGVFRGLEKL